MTERSGPFRIFAREHSVITEGEGPDRQFGCTNYSDCLSLAATLNWDSFTCRGCTGTIDEAIRWRAKGASKRDALLRGFCQVPNPPVVHAFIAPKLSDKEVPQRSAKPVILRSIALREDKEAKNG